MQKTLFQTIYYFMINPFHLSQNYVCQNTINGTVKNTATFKNIGPLTVSVLEQVYPNCTIGQIGFSKNAYFLSLLPTTAQFFVIEKRVNSIEGSAQNWELRVGGGINSQYAYFPPAGGPRWMAPFHDVTFNGITLGPQNVSLETDEYYLDIPIAIYDTVRSQLLRNFYCIEDKNIIYCPCTTGISSSFPSFYLNTLNTSFLIKPVAYLTEQD
jgi:hypothetical protein